MAAVLLLAPIGAAALLSRLGRALLRVALRAAEVTAAKGLVEIGMRRGDLTGLAERRVAERSARRSRRRELAAGAFWALWMVVPLFTHWALEAYAVAAPLWLLPGASLRPRPKP
jgi:hypothetical protein